MIGKGHIPSPAELLTFVVFIYICIYISYIRKKKRTCAYMGQNHSKNNFFVFSVVINSN